MPTIASASGDAALLIVDISLCLCAKVGYVSECGVENGGSRWPGITRASDISVDLPGWNPVRQSAELNERKGNECQLTIGLSVRYVCGVGPVRVSLVELGSSISLGVEHFVLFIRQSDYNEGRVACTR